MNQEKFLTLEEQRVADDRKIEAIKMYRERTGVSLKDGKEEVEKYLFDQDSYKIKMFSTVEHLYKVEAEILGRFSAYESVMYKIQKQLDKTQVRPNNETMISYLLQRMEIERNEMIKDIKSHILQYSVKKCSACTKRCTCEKKECEK